MRMYDTPELIEFDELITPDGLIYRLHGGNARFVVGGMSGQGMPRVDWKTQSAPRQHGETVIDYRLTPRVIQMVHRRNAYNRDHYHAMRLDIVNHFRPNRSAGDDIELPILRKVYKDGSKRDIYVRLDEGLQFRSADPVFWDEYSIEEPIRLICPDPAFFDPDEVLFSFVFTGTPINHLTFPCTFPRVFGVLAVLTGSDDITYLGTWQTRPTIEIDGPLNSALIRNVTTDEKIQFGYNIASGERVTIELQFGEVAVYNNTGDNLIGAVSTDSDLGTFHIAPAPEAPGGVNTITAYGTNADGNTAVTIRYYDRYIGI